VLAWLWVLYGVLGVSMRVREGDNMLKEFDKDQEASRKAVPCRIFLGVY
jgi:hypothetical protein